MTHEIDYDINQAVRVKGASLSLVPPRVRDMLTPDNTEPREVGSIIIESVVHMHAVGPLGLVPVEAVGHSVLLMRVPQLAQIYATLDELCEVSPAFAEDFRASVDQMRASLNRETLMARDVDGEVEEAVNVCMILRPAVAGSDLASCTLPQGHEGDHREGDSTWPR